MKIFISWAVFVACILGILLSPCWIALATGNDNNLWFLAGFILSVPSCFCFLNWVDDLYQFRFYE